VFDAPLVRIVSGFVADVSGKTLQGVDVEADGAHYITNRCALTTARAMSIQWIFPL
jgi:hypothetical protein